MANSALVKTNNINVSSTTSDTFQIDSDNTGPKLKNSSGVLQVRNEADDAFVKLSVLTPTADENATTKLYVDSKCNSMIRLDTGNGHGSTNTKIRRFTNVTSTTGTNITYADSAANGASLTINKAGVYAISDWEYNVATARIGISLNSSELTTAIQSIAVADRLGQCTVYDNAPYSVSAVVILAVNDVIRPHTDGTLNSTSAQSGFIITQVA